MIDKDLLEKRLRENFINQRVNRIPLADNSYGVEEIEEILDSLISGNITMGKKVEKFEKEFAEYIGTKYAVMVNSGSSANLLSLSILSNPEVESRIKPGDEIIVPAVTWSTTIYPIINIGAIPVLVDVDEDYLINVSEIKKNITDKTKAIIPVHLLGNVCNMDEICEIAEENNLYVIEDTCEALGSEYKNKKAGSIGDISTFSFYFSHHITTIEGGMLCTNNEQFADLARILRAHGYVRNSLRKEEYVKKYPNIDPRFLFVNIGYNFRPTELQAAMGLHQIKKLDKFLKIRERNAKFLNENLSRYSDFLILPKEKEQTRHSWFCYPITVKENRYFKREDLTLFLESKGIETRPLVAGNFADQPGLQLFKYRRGNLKYSEYIMKNSFYIGNNPSNKEEDLLYIKNAFNEFFNQFFR